MWLAKVSFAIRNSGLWNPEYGLRNPDPSNDWNPNPSSTEKESKKNLTFPFMGRKRGFAGLSWQAALSSLSQRRKSGIGKIGELSFPFTSIF